MQKPNDEKKTAAVATQPTQRELREKKLAHALKNNLQRRKQAVAAQDSAQ